MQKDLNRHKPQIKKNQSHHNSRYKCSVCLAYDQSKQIKTINQYCELCKGSHIAYHELNQEQTIFQTNEQKVQMQKIDQCPGCKKIEDSLKNVYSRLKNTIQKINRLDLKTGINVKKYQLPFYARQQQKLYNYINKSEQFQELIKLLEHQENILFLLTVSKTQKNYWHFSQKFIIQQDKKNIIKLQMEIYEMVKEFILKYSNENKQYLCLQCQKFYCDACIQAHSVYFPLHQDLVQKIKFEENLNQYCKKRQLQKLEPINLNIDARQFFPTKIHQNVIKNKQIKEKKVKQEILEYQCFLYPEDSIKNYCKTCQKRKKQGAMTINKAIFGQLSKQYFENKKSFNFQQSQPIQPENQNTKDTYTKQCKQTHFSEIKYFCIADKCDNRRVCPNQNCLKKHQNHKEKLIDFTLCIDQYDQIVDESCMNSLRSNDKQSFQKRYQQKKMWHVKNYKLNQYKVWGLQYDKYVDCQNVISGLAQFVTDRKEKLIYQLIDKINEQFDQLIDDLITIGQSFDSDYYKQVVKTLKTKDPIQKALLEKYVRDIKNMGQQHLKDMGLLKQCCQLFADKIEKSFKNQINKIQKEFIINLNQSVRNLKKQSITQQKSWIQEITNRKRHQKIQHLVKNNDGYVRKLFLKTIQSGWSKKKIPQIQKKLSKEMNIRKIKIFDLSAYNISEIPQVMRYFQGIQQLILG